MPAGLDVPTGVLGALPIGRPAGNACRCNPGVLDTTFGALRMVWRTICGVPSTFRRMKRVVTLLDESLAAIVDEE